LIHDADLRTDEVVFSFLRRKSGLLSSTLLFLDYFGQSL